MSNDDSKKPRDLIDQTERFWKEAQSPMMKLVRGTMEAAEKLRAMTETPAVKAMLEHTQTIADQINAAAQSPAAKAMLEHVKAIAESPVMRSIAESHKLDKLMAHSSAVDRMLMLPPGYQELIDQQKTYQREAFASITPPPVARQQIRAERDAERDAALQRQRIFLALVQTRALFHDCQQVMKLKSGESYSALAPNIVLAAFEFPTDQIDEDVATHAEAFVRAGVKGATG